MQEREYITGFKMTYIFILRKLYHQYSFNPMSCFMQQQAYKANEKESGKINNNKTTEPYTTK